MICKECGCECKKSNNKSNNQKYCKKCVKIVRAKQLIKSMAKYYKKHKKKIKKRVKGYRDENKKAIKDVKKKYYKTEKGLLETRKYNLKRRAKMNKIIHDFSNAEWLEKLRATNGICPECNKYVGIFNLHLDHIHPISKAKEGQIYTIKDIQPLCKSCNSKKSNKVVEG